MVEGGGEGEEDTGVERVEGHTTAMVAGTGEEGGMVVVEGVVEAEVQVKIGVRALGLKNDPGWTVWKQTPWKHSTDPQKR